MLEWYGIYAPLQILAALAIPDHFSMSKKPSGCAQIWPCEAQESHKSQKRWPLSMMTIWNCWCKAGILPEALYYEPAVTAPSVSVSCLLNSELLDGLVLQKRNQMDLEELLNLASEQQLVDEIPGDKIFWSACLRQSRWWRWMVAMMLMTIL